MKFDKLFEVITVPVYKSPLVQEIRARGVVKKDGCMCKEKDYVFADNEG